MPFSSLNDVRSPFTQPEGHLTLNTHPINEGSVSCWLPGQEATGARDLVGDFPGVDVGSNVLRVGTDYGVGAKINATAVTDRINLGSITSSDALSGVPSDRMSILVVAYVPSSAGGTQYPRWFDKSNGGNASNGWAFYPDLTGSIFGIQSNGGTYHSSAFVDSLDQVSSIAATYDASANESFRYHNGKLAGSTSTSLSSFPTTTTNAALLNWNIAGGRMFEYPVYLIRIWDRTLSTEEMAELGADPYLGIDNGSLYFPAVSLLGSTFTITPSGGIVFSGANSITPLNNFTIAPSGSIDFSGNNAITALNNWTITPSGEITFSGANAITFSTGAVDYVITPSGGLVFSGSNQIIPENNYTISPSGGLTLSGTNTITAFIPDSFTITPSGGLLFSGNNDFLITKVMDVSGGISFTGFNSITSNTVTVTTRLPLTGVGK